MKSRLLKTLYLFRAGSTHQGTPGILTYQNQRVCYMLELPDRDNKRNLSRIPAGRYLVKYLKRSASGKYKDVYHVTGVMGRSGVLIHPGNYAGDTLQDLLTHSWGCLLPATRMGRLSNQMAGLASRAALRRIHQITQRQDFYLEVI